MQTKFAVIILTLFASFSAMSQIDSSYVAIDSVAVDTIAVAVPNNTIVNPNSIAAFYQKLSVLEQQKSGTISIVHIGDSHIQADLMTNKIRRSLQEIFGNGGRGFVFPHSLAKTNGSSDVRFSSASSWESYRNIYAPNGSAVGLSGIAFAAKSPDAAFELQTKDPADSFTTIRLITPDNSDLFSVATERRTIVVETPKPKKITHKIRNGEALSIIADKYNVSITAIKKLNGLKSNNIRAGKTLRIPANETINIPTERYEYVPLDMSADSDSHYFATDSELQKIYVLSNSDAAKPALNGIILDNGKPGIQYHNIGVNGAKLSDYTKYPMFFTQLKSLHPDLVVISLGTNESFDKITSDEYQAQLQQFIRNVRLQNPTTSILVVTPPPSLFQRKYPNTFAAAYAKSILDNAEPNNFAVWDLYSQLGGLYGVSRNAAKGIIGGDRVHYTKAGYELQGNLMVSALLSAYSDFKNSRK